ncbi:MAG: FeoA family protein [Clostridia bacterium]
MNFCSLDTVKIGKTAKILYINCNKIIKRRLLDLGIIENSNITPVFRSPFKILLHT